MRQGVAVLAAILALPLLVAACGGDAPTATPMPTPTPTESAPAEADDASGDSALAERLSEKTMRLWQVYNTYDIDGLSAFYEETYWAAEEAEIRSNMQPFRNGGITFTARETSPPTEIAPGEWELRHTASFPGGLINMVFIYEEFDGEWLLTHAELE